MAESYSGSIQSPARCWPLPSRALSKCAGPTFLSVHPVGRATRNGPSTPEKALLRRAVREYTPEGRLSRS